MHLLCKTLHDVASDDISCLSESLTRVPRALPRNWGTVMDERRARKAILRQGDMSQKVMGLNPRAG